MVSFSISIFTPKIRVYHIFLLLGKLPFKWLNNKLAVVEEETNAEYIAYQYFIRNKWALKVIQNPNPGPKWILKKKNENGDFVTLFGKQKSYPECKEEIPKRILK